MQSALKTMDTLTQQEMCRLFSSEFSGIDVMQLQPFVAVMRMLKLEYATSNPALYRLLITLLRDYDPSLGQSHIEKTKTYLHVLLMDSPELADYLQAVLPSPDLGLNTSCNTLHSRRVSPKQSSSIYKRDEEIIHVDNTTNRKSGQENIGAKQFYNFISPAVSAYLEAQGVPTRVTSQASSSVPCYNTQPVPSIISASTSPPRHKALAQMACSKCKPCQSPVTLTSPSHGCAPSALKLPRMLIHKRKSCTTGDDYPSYAQLTHKMMQSGGRISLVPKHSLTGRVEPTTTVTRQVITPVYIGTSPSPSKKDMSRCQVSGERYDTISQTTPASLSTHCSTVSSMTFPRVHVHHNFQEGSQDGKLFASCTSNTKPVKVQQQNIVSTNSTDNLGNITLHADEKITARVRNLATFPYAQQMTIINGVTQNIVVNREQDCDAAQRKRYLSCNNPLDHIKHPLVYLQHMANNPTMASSPLQEKASMQANRCQKIFQDVESIVVITDEEDSPDDEEDVAKSCADSSVHSTNMEDDLLLLKQMEG